MIRESSKIQKKINLKLFDIDGCLFHNVRKRKNEDPIEKWLIEENQSLLNSLIEDIDKNSYDIVILGYGTNRQSLRQDVANAGGTCTPVLPILQSYLQNNVQCEVLLEPFLMADIYGNNAHANHTTFVISNHASPPTAKNNQMRELAIVAESLFIRDKEMKLTAYWHTSYQNDNIASYSILLEESAKDIVQELPKVGEQSENTDLAKKILSLFNLAIHKNNYAGESYKKLLRYFHKDIKDDEHAFYVFDEYKITLIYAHAHRAAILNQDREIVVDFYDDRKDILGALYKTFNGNTQLLPKNISFCLYQYKEGRFGNKIYESKINGTGEIDSRFDWSVRYIAAKNQKFSGGPLANISCSSDLHTYHYNREYTLFGRDIEMYIWDFDDTEFLNFRGDTKNGISAMESDPRITESNTYTTAEELFLEGLIPRQYVLNLSEEKSSFFDKKKIVFFGTKESDTSSFLKNKFLSLLNRLTTTDCKITREVMLDLTNAIYLAVGIDTNLACTSAHATINIINFEKTQEKSPNDSIRILEETLKATQKNINKIIDNKDMRNKITLVIEYIVDNIKLSQLNNISLNLKGNDANNNTTNIITQNNQTLEIEEINSLQKCFIL